MFASGAVMMICGASDDLGQETKVICTKCGKCDYAIKDALNRFSLSDIFESDNKVR